jgi:hypothetical protein
MAYPCSGPLDKAIADPPQIAFWRQAFHDRFVDAGYLPEVRRLGGIIRSSAQISRCVSATGFRSYAAELGISPFALPLPMSFQDASIAAGRGNVRAEWVFVNEREFSQPPLLTYL